MRLLTDEQNLPQADPFIFEDAGKLYIYITGLPGVRLYSADDLFGMWHYEGIVATVEGAKEFWAPSVIKYGDTYYMYVSFTVEGEFDEYMHVFTASKPEGPFTVRKMLYNEFSIDSHVVETSEGLFLWYAKNGREGDRIGTRVYVDKLIDPLTPEGKPVEKIVPTFDEEIFTPQYTDDCRWHTIEGPFWFKEGDWQYVMYSGGCYMDDTYHIGYSCAKSNEEDLTCVEFIKNTKDGGFAPVIIKNEFEEGTGHHSVIKYKGEYYAVYHGRDYEENPSIASENRRNMRVCKLFVKDGVITAERYPDKV